MRRPIPGNLARLAATAFIGLVPFLLSSCGGNDTSPARGCSTSGSGIIPLGCFGDGRSDHGPHSQSCQASEYSYYNVHLQLDPNMGESTRLEIADCTIQVTDEAGDVLEDRALLTFSGAAACAAGQTPYDVGTLDYSSCCRAGALLHFELAADSMDSNPLAQGGARATCMPGQVERIDLVVQGNLSTLP
jgi:hypothetical protein